MAAYNLKQAKITGLLYYSYISKLQQLSCIFLPSECYIDFQLLSNDPVGLIRLPLANTPVWCLILFIEVPDMCMTLFEVCEKLKQNHKQWFDFLILIYKKKLSYRPPKRIIRMTCLQG